MGHLSHLYAPTVEDENDATKIATITAAQQIIANAVAGRLAVVTTGGTTTLDGTVELPNAQNMFLDVSGTLASAGIIQIPVSATSGRNRIYVVKNGTAGTFSLTVRAVGGTGVTITQGKTALLLYDGSDIVHLISDLANFGASAWSSWTPTWTNLTVGNGVLTAKYIQIGKLIMARVHLVWGSSTAITPAPDVSFTLPVTRAAYGGGVGQTPLGQVSMFDTSAGFIYKGCLENYTTTTAGIRVYNVTGVSITEALVTAAVPFAWGTGDEINAQFSYEAA